MTDPMAIWAVSALAVAAVVAALSALRGAAGFGTLAGLMIAGGAAQLALTEPRNALHLRLRPDSAAEAGMLALIAVEAVVAAFVLWRAWRNAGRPLPRWSVGAGLAVLAVGALLSVSVLGSIPRGAYGGFVKYLMAGSVVLTIHLAAAIGLLTLRPPLAALPGLGGPQAAIVALLSAAALAWFGFNHLPHVEDEYAYLFQARTLAGGDLSVPAPPEAARPLLDYYLLEIDGDRWQAVTTPGWSAILALGSFTGAEWLVNPILAALAAALAVAVARRAGDARTAGLTGFLFATSPWVLAAGATLMTHMLTIMLALLAWWILGQRRNGPGLPAALAAGLAMGWVFFTRPLDGVIAGGLTGVWLLALSGGVLTSRIARSAAYLVGCVATGSLYFLFNRATTGSIFGAPLERYLDRLWGEGTNRYGFGDGIGPPAGSWGMLDPFPGHGPYEGILNALHNLTYLQFDLFGWGIGSLAGIVLFLRLGRFGRFDAAMAAVALTTIVAMFFYWFSGGFYIGPRYWFMLAFPVIWLSARGLVALADRIGTGGEARVGSVVAVLAVQGLLVFLPWKSVAVYFTHENVLDDMRRAAADGRFGNAVVLVRDEAADPASHFVLNDPRLAASEGPVFLTDTGDIGPDAEAALRAAFPGRDVVRFSPSR